MPNYYFLNLRGYTNFLEENNTLISLCILTHAQTTTCWILNSRNTCKPVYQIWTDTKKYFTKYKHLRFYFNYSGLCQSPTVPLYAIKLHQTHSKWLVPQSRLIVFNQDYSLGKQWKCPKHSIYQCWPSDAWMSGKCCFLSCSLKREDHALWQWKRVLCSQ